MAKDRESITIDPNVNKKIHTLREKEGRSYSNMIQEIIKRYFKRLTAHPK